jgi:glucose/arabinose dehydrogenase
MLRGTAVAVVMVAGGASMIAGAIPTSGSDDWKQDRPGRVHHVDLAHLPAPFATAAASNPPKLVPRPPDARLEVPAGFRVAEFATGLRGPRTMRLAPNGDIFVAETKAGRIAVLRPTSDGSKATRIATFASGLVNPFGMAFYPHDQPQWLYVAETNRVVRYPYRSGDISASGAAQTLVTQLAPHATGGHITRDLVFSRDERSLYVSVGSGSNIADDMPKKTAAEAKAWQRDHALGAAWGDETDRADVLLFAVGDGGTVSGAGRVYATGLRNCAGLTLEPDTGDLWCTVNERDLLGDNLPPDYSTRVREGGFYGWPWYYLGSHQDPRLKGERPDLAGKVLLPDVPYQAHSAPLNLIFYSASTGSAAFPSEYVGDGFAVLHGSWDRALRTGYKVVRVRMRNGMPTGEYDDFLVGYIVDNDDVWGRPVGALENRDGALLISDDGGNVIYRVSYSH